MGQGFAVFTYDKRTCTTLPGCHNTLCVASGQKNCLNVTNLQFTDFIQDAQNAVAALRADPRVNPADVTVVGHSQGCTIAPYVANEANLSKVVLLMGGGSDIGGTQFRQANAAI